MFTRSSQERHELTEKVKELEAQCKDMEMARLKMLERNFFNKMLIFSMLHKLKGAPEET